MSDMKSKCEKIAVFGLSANPPTGDTGHLGIIKYFVQTNLFSEIWVLPVYQHMFADKKGLELYGHRIEMCKISMEPESTPQCVVRVLSIEKEAYEHFNKGNGAKIKRVGTVDVLDYLNEKYGDRYYAWHLVLGSDTYRDLAAGKWKQSDRIMTMARIEVISRIGVEEKSPEWLIEIDSPRTIAKKRVFHRSIPWLTGISSSSVRNMQPFLFSVWPFILKEELYQSVHPKVYHYMKNNRLFMFTPAYFARRIQFGVLGLSALFVLMSSYISSNQKIQASGFVGTVLGAMSRNK